VEALTILASRTNGIGSRDNGNATYAGHFMSSR
jgi:hypothetical protein